MSKYTDPSNFTNALIEAAIGLLLVVAALGLAVWILSRIWLWVLGAALLACGVWLIIQWFRRRSDTWY